MRKTFVLLIFLVFSFFSFSKKKLGISFQEYEILCENSHGIIDAFRLKVETLEGDGFSKSLASVSRDFKKIFYQKNRLFLKKKQKSKL